MTNTDPTDRDRNREFEELAEEPSRENAESDQPTREADEAEFEELAEEPAREEDASGRDRPQ